MSLNDILGYLKKYWYLTALMVIGLLILFFPKSIKRIFRGAPKRKRRRKTTVRPAQRSRRRSLPRSVGMKKRSVNTRGSGYPAAGGGTIPYKYNKDGTIKKAWQVAGTVAARRRMSQLRKSR